MKLGRALLALDSDNALAFPAAAANLKKLLDADPPPSPRQLALAHLARALLVSRVQVAIADSQAAALSQNVDGWYIGSSAPPISSARTASRN